MTKIIVLILALWPNGSDKPIVQRVQAQTLEDCMTYAKAFLESDTAKNAVGASAGCIMSTPGKDA